MSDMTRHEFIALIGGAGLLLAVKVRRARAQQPAVPVIGFLNGQSSRTWAPMVAAFRRGLNEAGYVEGQNVANEYRWAEGRYDRLPALAAELVRRQVAVIAATGGHPSALPAKAATTTIPIIFVVADDPVRLGLVANLARPGGNLTGINILTTELVAKRLELLRELVPAATRVAVFVNPTNAEYRDHVERRGAGCSRHGTANPGSQRQHQPRDRFCLRKFYARATRCSFHWQRRLLHQPCRAIGPLGRPLRHTAITGSRLYTEAGGLMNYGSSLTDAYRQLGVYAGRILKGAKPEDLPVVQSSKLELVINLQTAKLIGVNPPTLLARADEVIE
jgi:ABC-type uncharacterized transport system substrate-binding protein